MGMQRTGNDRAVEGMEFDGGAEAIDLETEVLGEAIENAEEERFDLRFSEAETMNGFDFGNAIVADPEFGADGVEGGIFGLAIPVNDGSRGSGDGNFKGG